MAMRTFLTLSLCPSWQRGCLWNPEAFAGGTWGLNTKRKDSMVSTYYITYHNACWQIFLNFSVTPWRNVQSTFWAAQDEGRNLLAELVWWARRKRTAFLGIEMHPCFWLWCGAKMAQTEKAIQSLATVWIVNIFGIWNQSVSESLPGAEEDWRSLVVNSEPFWQFWRPTNLREELSLRALGNCYFVVEVIVKACFLWLILYNCRCEGLTSN